MHKGLKNLLLSVSILGLVACSTTGNKSTSDNSDNDGGATVVASDGLNDEASSDSFGANGDAKAMRVGNQHYYFDFDKDTVHDVDSPSIRVQGQYLATHPNAKVLLTGNTDDRGSREYNVALGNRRANAVEKLLEVNGAASNQITVVSYGAEKPVALGHDEASYVKNRRVDLIYQTAIQK